MKMLCSDWSVINGSNCKSDRISYSERFDLSKLYCTFHDRVDFRKCTITHSCRRSSNILSSEENYSAFENFGLFPTPFRNPVRLDFYRNELIFENGFRLFDISAGSLLLIACSRHPHQSLKWELPSTPAPWPQDQGWDIHFHFFIIVALWIWQNILFITKIVYFEKKSRIFYFHQFLSGNFWTGFQIPYMISMLKFKIISGALWKFSRSRRFDRLNHLFLSHYNYQFQFHMRYVILIQRRFIFELRWILFKSEKIFDTSFETAKM